jgi:hypothetical protein
MSKFSATGLLTAIITMNASAMNIPVIDMADICNRYFQDDPAAIANYEMLKNGQDGIDPVKTCADFKRSALIDVSQPESTARLFMAQIADVNPNQVRVEVRKESSQSVIATATASGKVCTFSLSPAPEGVTSSWLVGALDCTRNAGSGGIPVIDNNAIEKASHAATE